MAHPAQILGQQLLTDGVYRVRVLAAETVGTNVGSYRLAVFDADTDENPLELDRRYTGSLETPFSIDRWTFTRQRISPFALIGSTPRHLRFVSGSQGQTAGWALTE